MDLTTFLTSSLKISSDEAKTLVRKRNPIEVLKEVRAECDPKMYDAVDKMIVVETFSACREIEKVRAAFEAMSLFEVRLCVKHPLYMLYGYNVSIRECIEFAKKCDIPIDAKRVAYAVAYQTISEHREGTVEFAEMQAKMREHGLVLDLTIRPFGMDPLRGHPLEFIDTTVTPASNLPCAPWERSQLLKEKNICETEITLTSSNKYVIGNVSRRLALLLHRMG